MLYQLENEKLQIVINSLGAELQNIILKSNSTEYLWPADAQYWARHAPVLFPIVGKLKNNQYYYENQKYELSQHGFARDSEFNLIEQFDNKITFQLNENENTLKIYPFKFCLRIIYTLSENQLIIQYQIHNPDTKPLYFSIGSHEAFNCPLTTKNKFENYSLKFSADEQLERTFLVDGLRSEKTEIITLTNNHLTLNEKLFQNDALIFENLKSREVILCEHHQTKIKFQFADFPYFAIWKKANANFLCLEAWAGLADPDESPKRAGGHLVSKKGIMALAAGATREFEHMIVIAE